MRRRRTFQPQLERLELRLVPTTFSPPTSIRVGFAPNDAVIADFNNDGKPDLVVSNGQSAFVSYLRGLGTGAFASPVSFASGDKPQSVVAGDFNGDGNMDVAVGNYYANTVSVMLGNGNGTFG